MFFEPKDLGSSRAILSFLYNLDKLDGCTLKLPKKLLTEHWSRSTSTRAIIARAAASLADCNCFDVVDGVAVRHKPFVLSAEVSTYEVTFTINPEVVRELKELRNLVFGKYELADLVVNSRFTLNMLICCLQFLSGKERYIPNTFMRQIMCSVDKFQEDAMFNRDVVTMAFKDLSVLKKHPISHEAKRELNSQTKQWKSFGINVHWKSRKRV